MRKGMEATSVNDRKAKIKETQTVTENVQKKQKELQEQHDALIDADQEGSDIASKIIIEYIKEIRQLINMEIGYINIMKNAVNLSDEEQIHFNLQCRIKLQDLICRKIVLAEKLRTHLNSDFIDDETREQLICINQEVGRRMGQRLEKMSLKINTNKETTKKA